VAVRIRLRRVGRKKNPEYRIVVADSASPRDGRFIEKIGEYHPRRQDAGLSVNAERALYWLGVGAQPSDTVRSLLRRAGVLRTRHERRLAGRLQSQAVPLRERSESTGEATSGAE
jgi:small subunit ribosomal protein S16